MVGSLYLRRMPGSSCTYHLDLEHTKVEMINEQTNLVVGADLKNSG